MGSNSETKVKCMVRSISDHNTGNVAILVADLGAPGRPAAIIDPLESRVETYEQLMKEFGDLKLTYILQTHVPCDNSKSGALLLKNHFPEAKTVISKASAAQADILVEGGDKIEIGGFALEVKATPGHTKGCVSYVTVENPQMPTPFAFPGHSLLIRGSGRTDLEGGNAEELYQSVHSQLFTLTPRTHVVPGFDYNRAGLRVTTVREEKAHNPYFMKK